MDADDDPGLFDPREVEHVDPAMRTLAVDVEAVRRPDNRNVAAYKDRRVPIDLVQGLATFADPCNIVCEGARPPQVPFGLQPDRRDAAVGDRDRRSEEHTSELQSLMRISYAVFCLKKKKRNQT